MGQFCRSPAKLSRSPNVSFFMGVQLVRGNQSLSFSFSPSSPSERFTCNDIPICFGRHRSTTVYSHSFAHDATRPDKVTNECNADNVCRSHATFISATRGALRLLGVCIQIFRPNTVSLFIRRILSSSDGWWFAAVPLCIYASV